MKKETEIKRTALVTGASSGIGRALSAALADAGYDLILIARREDRLGSLKQELLARCPARIETAVCDIRDTEAMRKVIGEASRKLGRLDVVVANAGYTIAGRFEDLRPEDYRAIFESNVIGMLNTLYPSMEELEESRGTAVIMGSILGEFGILDRSAYVTTKFALRGFYESVRYELKERGISTLLVEPGFVSTELRFFDHAGNRLKEMTPETRKKTSHGIAVSPEAVAGPIVRLLSKKGFRRSIITGHAKVFYFLNWIAPGLVSRMIYRHRDWVRRKVIK